jgi:hypothetical protein
MTTKKETLVCSEKSENNNKEKEKHSNKESSNIKEDADVS